MLNSYTKYCEIRERSSILSAGFADIILEWRLLEKGNNISYLEMEIKGTSKLWAYQQC